MILSSCIILIFFLSNSHKEYKWPICFCPKCQKKMWGHGYVGRYFLNFTQQIFLKRYRCSSCKTVVTIRPEEYFAYVRTPIETIHRALQVKISTGSWPSDCPRQRGGHWLRQFVRHAKMSYENNFLIFLDRCFEKKINFFTSKKVELFSQVFHPT